jgi:hypothetical protein
MRGSNVFVRTASRVYGQPTCNFYLDAMQRKIGHDNVLVIAKDARNVCTDLCRKKGAILHLGDSIEKDFSIMLHAKRLVTSRSTLMRAVMYLSPVAKIWYYFGSSALIDCGMDEWPLHLWPVFGPRQVCIPSREFEKHVVLEWSINKAPLLIKEKCTWYLDTGILNESVRDTIKKVWNG